MAKYIELIGIPGIGKTTSCHCLRKKYGKQMEFLYNDEDIISISGSKILKKKIFNKISRPFKRKSIGNCETNYLQNFIRENPELNDRFWKARTVKDKGRKQDMRFTTSKYTANIFEKIQKVRDSKSDKLFVVDEGLIHCIKNFTCELDKKTFEQQLLDILELIPLPEGVVFFGGDESIAVERSKNRKYQREKDKLVCNRELLENRGRFLKIIKSCIDLLIQKKIPVLFLDANERVETKADKIFSFVNEIVKAEKLKFL